MRELLEEKLTKLRGEFTKTKNQENAYQNALMRLWLRFAGWLKFETARSINSAPNRGPQLERTIEKFSFSYTGSVEIQFLDQNETDENGNGQVAESCFSLDLSLPTMVGELAENRLLKQLANFILKLKIFRFMRPPLT